MNDIVDCCLSYWCDSKFEPFTSVLSSHIQVVSSIDSSAAPDCRLQFHPRCGMSVSLSNGSHTALRPR